MAGGRQCALGVRHKPVSPLPAPSPRTGSKRPRTATAGRAGAWPCWRTKEEGTLADALVP